MLNCHDTTRLLSEGQERELLLRERMALWMHLSMCRGCRNFGTQMEALRRFTRAYARGEDESAEGAKRPSQ